MGSQSTALWCSLRQDRVATDLEGHFNYWRMTGGETPSPDFLDIGIMLYESAEVESVSIYLPLNLDAADVEDLGQTFAPAVAQGIFNEPLEWSQPPDQRWIDLRREGGALYCRVAILEDDDVTLEPEGLGTVVVITPAAIGRARGGLNQGDKLYLRLRVFVRVSDSPFVTVIHPTDRRFQSGYEEIEYVSFSLNEARTLPRRIETMMQEEAGTSRLVLVAFLTAVPVLSEVSVSGTTVHKSRLLERQIWDSYVRGGIPEGMMVYHWRAKEENGLDNFSTFVKLRTRRTGRKILFTYLAIAFLFGVFGNLAASGVEWIWTKLAYEDTGNTREPAEREANSAVQDANLARSRGE